MKLLRLLPAAFALLLLPACSLFFDPTEDELLAETGAKALTERDFYKASLSFVEASEFVKGQDHAKFKSYQASLGDVYFRWARTFAYTTQKLRTRQEYETGIRLCEHAKLINPRRRYDANSMIDEFKLRLRIMNHLTSPYTEEELEQMDKRMMQIFNLQQEAAALYHAKLYSEAMPRLMKILELDPYDINAAATLKSIAVELYNAGAPRRAELKKDEERVVSVPWSRDTQADTNIMLSDATQMQKFLKSLSLPVLSMDNVPLWMAFSILSKAALDEGKLTVNFRFMNFDPTIRENFLVEFYAENITLEEALNAICNSMGLYYKIDKKNRIEIYAHDTVGEL